MFDAALVPLAVGYTLLGTVLVLFSANVLYLTAIAWRHRGVDPPAPPLERVPFVTVQIPLYNEHYVCERVIDAVSRLDWPRDRWEIQVLDDSTDETRDVVRRAVAAAAARGLDITVIHRAAREGFKAGALGAALPIARGEFIAYFDADFLPPADFLRRAIPHFADKQVAFVQARWGHLNRGFSLLTRIQALMLDTHFAVEQLARNRGGYIFNFTGTAGVWRRVAIEDAGGWSFATLTEDIDISYRVFLAGWKAVYLRDLVCPAELPVTMTGFLRQQLRWAQGILQCSTQLLPKVWRGPLALSVKAQATFHLTVNLLHLGMFGLLIAYPLLILLADRLPDVVPLAVLIVIWTVPSLVWPLVLVVGQCLAGEDWRRTFLLIPVTTVLGTALMLVTVHAAWSVVRGDRPIFLRTPKFGIVQRRGRGITSRYHLFSDALLPSMGVVAGWALVLMALSLMWHTWMLTVYPMLLLLGALAILLTALVQNIRMRAAAAAEASERAA